MFIIVAKSNLKPGNAEIFKATAKPLIDGSRAEAGNISYDLFEDVKNPNVLTFIEKWKDDAAIEFHNNTPHFTQTIVKLAALVDGEMDVTVYSQVL
jgi:quinol monooxygenase YgiN